MEAIQLFNNNIQDKDTVLDAFIREFGSALQNYIHSLVKQREVAEDIYQDTLLSAFLAYDRFDHNATVKTWIYKIAINKCYDKWRKEKSERDFLNEKIHDYLAPQAVEPSPEDIIIQRYDQKEIHEQVNRLPDKYRNSVYLYYFGDYKIGEISKETNIPISTVKTHLRRAKERLKITNVYFEAVAE